MNNRVKVALLCFLGILVFYTVRNAEIVLNFKRTKIASSVVILPAKYGDILSSDGIPILQNKVVYNVYLDVDYAKVLSRLDGWNYERRVSDAVRYFGFNPNAQIVSKIISSGNGGIEIGLLDGKKIKNAPKKFLPFLNIQRSFSLTQSASAFSVITNALKKGYSPYLQPKRNGKMIYNPFYPYDLSSKIKNIISPINGDTIVTTVNFSIQNFAQQMINEDVKSNKAHGGEVIISDPQNGHILAMASTWKFDAPIMNLFQPASTMKPLIFCEALQEGVVSTKTTFSGPYYIPDPKISLVVRDAEPHPWPVSLKDALVYSSDVAEMKIATRLIDKIGSKSYYDWFKKFGFGRKTGIDLPGEVNGILTPVNKWYGIGGQEMAIGQSIAVTGIQMITALNAVVNGGYWIRPNIVKEIISPSGSIVYQYHPLIKKIFKTDVTNIVRKFMIGVVKKGTGIPAQIKGVLVGGKTGTAEKPYDGKVSLDGPWFSLFYGFFPANDPRYSIYVMVDQPSNGLFYGEDVAAPLIHSIGTYILKMSQSHVKNYEFSPFKMPDLEGLPLDEAITSLEELSIPPSKISFSGNGVVVSQTPSPGTMVNEVKSVKLRLASS